MPYCAGLGASWWGKLFTGSGNSQLRLDTTEIRLEGAHPGVNPISKVHRLAVDHRLIWATVRLADWPDAVVVKGIPRHQATRHEGGGLRGEHRSDHAVVDGAVGGAETPRETHRECGAIFWKPPRDGPDGPTVVSKGPNRRRCSHGPHSRHSSLTLYPTRVNRHCRAVIHTSLSDADKG